MQILHPKPMRKREFYRLQHQIGLPYPNYELGEDELPILCRCFKDENGFYVIHQQDIPTLYRNGAFGQSNITLRGPTSLMEGNHEEKYYYQKIKERKTKQDGEDGKTSGRNEANGESPFKNSESMSKVPYRNGGFSDEVEKLILLPEEVIFLSFAVGCISIQNAVSLEMLSYVDVWKSLVQGNSEFPYIYAVYHYFRSKNWVPKCGLQYGGDYVLYHVGPDFYHSTYVVHIAGLPSRPRLTWCELHALQRVAVTSNKNVLLCEVHIPDHFVPTESTPQSIFDIGIRETVVSRWTPFGKAETQED